MGIIGDKIDISDRATRDNGKIDIAEINKGNVITTHNAISATTTSIAIDHRGYNAVDVEVIISGSGDWDIEIVGCAISDGTFLSNDPQLIKSGITSSTRFQFLTTANYIEVVATENSGTATLTCKITPIVMPIVHEVYVAGIGSIGDSSGQDTMANSFPVVIASDQSNVPVSQATHDSLNLNANMQVGDADVGGGNPVPVTLATTLDSSTDSIDIDKMSKGSVTTTHNAISGTATGSEIDHRGYNGTMLNMEGSLESGQTWTVEILGCAISGGTFGKGYYKDFEQKITLTYDDLSTDGVVNFTCPGVQNYVKIRATLSGGTAELTVKVTPVNL